MAAAGSVWARPPAPLRVLGEVVALAGEVPRFGASVGLEVGARLGIRPTSSSSPGQAGRAPGATRARSPGDLPSARRFHFRYYLELLHRAPA